MKVVQTARGIEAAQAGAFVPTMGALHEGHAALIRRAAELAGAGGGPVVVSIFVNPTQFAPGEDYRKYPRQLEKDSELAAASGAEFIFAPSVEEIYPPDRDVEAPLLPDVATRPGLEDAHRPTHFAGVCQVVARLFDLVRPRWAVFGEKDWQQLRVISAMARQEHPRWGALEIVPHPTLREADGLAMSSRNAYLRQGQREQALGLSRALKACEGAAGWREGELAMRDVLAGHGLAIDYAVVREAQTLLSPAPGGKARILRALIAARLDSVRLIDNAQVTF